MAKTKSPEEIQQERESLLKEFKGDERYHFVRTLGEGGVGKVDCYFDRHLNRVTAMKTLRKAARNKLRSLRSVIREARLISYLDHPGIVSVYDAFVNDNDDFTYTMKLIQGEVLEDLLYRDLDDDLSLTEYIEIFIKLCETMAYVHDKGVLHLDLKPSNIMLGHYGELLIVDWGNARLFDKTPYHTYLSTYKNAQKLEDLEEKEQFISGTPKYMSPEQTTSRRDQLRPTSDIFSVGVFFYELLSKKPPFPAEDLEGQLDQLHNFDPPSLHTTRPTIPKSLSNICAKMLEKSPADRYQSFHEVIKDIRKYLNSGQNFETKRYQRGEVIFKEGDPGGYALMVLSGYVEITAESDGERKFLANLGEGEVIGELSVFTNQPRTATAKALTPITVKILTQETIEQELDKLSPWIGRMITTLSNRFNKLNRRLIEMD